LPGKKNRGENITLCKPSVFKRVKSINRVQEPNRINTILLRNNKFVIDAATKLVINFVEFDGIVP
jgi:hypothetical protein